jgi:uroporphyrinogen-III synthase
MAPRVIVTRPQPQADEWVARLRSQGLDAVALPLLRIAAVADAAPVRAAWQALAQRQFVMFVSANAVASFFAAVPEGTAWPSGVLAGATGPGTVAALRARGVPPAQIAAPPADAAQFDSEALWQILRDQSWRGARSLIVRGEDGREWLADALREAGAEVSLLAAYRRMPPLWHRAEETLLAQALAAPRAHAWLFSSSQAIGHLVDHLRADPARAVPWPLLRAVATHPRIGQTAREAGFGEVHACGATPAEVAAALGSLAV